MDYCVKLTRTVAAAVVNLHPDIKKQVKKSFKELAGDPYSGNELQEELAGFLTYRFKRYRIIYKVDESKKYIPRDERPEWACVGLLGQLAMKKGQPVSKGWLKIKDISNQVELWLVK